MVFSYDEKLKEGNVQQLQLLETLKDYKINADDLQNRINQLEEENRV